MPPYGCGCEKDSASAEGWHMISNKPTRKARLHRAPVAEFLGPPRFFPGPSLDTKDCCLLEQGFLGFIIRQMCRHGNPSQASNLSLCRGMLSLLTAVFPPSTFLPSLRNWMGLSGQQREVVRLGTALETRKESGTFLSKILGDMLKVLVPNSMQYCHPAGQTGASL